ncbi:unnamed protein product [Staurois parvus]|uniref:Uncharacterized protein n=1 Tax=Staurois parvus TaxID=386267 RepID=A0ABN9DIW4_9NEOB|nr:unnamed protein product [Staurois parvus]
MGPPGNRDHGAPVSLPKLTKAYKKGTRGISWGPLLTPGPQAVPEFPNGQSAPGRSTEVHEYLGWTDNSWGPRGNRGSWGPCVLARTQKSQ